MAEWNAGCFDDPFGVSSGDVFGRDVLDVDVWQANDSFAEDEEWPTFNANDDGMPVESAPKIEGKKAKSSTENVKDDKEKRRSKSKSSSRERLERSKKPSWSSSPSKSKRGKTTNPFALRAVLDTDDDGDRGPGQRSSSAVSLTSSTSEEFQGRSRQRVPISPIVSPRSVVDPAKPKNAPCRPSDGDHSMSRDLLNGINNRSRAHSPSTRDSYFEGAPKTPDRPRRRFSDNALTSSYRTRDREVSSSPTVVRRKDGNVQPRRPGDRTRRRAGQSNNRRECVKDSLSKFLEDDLPPAPDTSSSRRGRGPNLQGIIRQNSLDSMRSLRSAPPRIRNSSTPPSSRDLPPAPDASSSRSRRGPNLQGIIRQNSLDSMRSLRSAPPRIRNSSTPPSSRDDKSRRRSKTMLSPSSKNQVTAAVESVAKEGYIEVVDGKMRLVFDVPSSWLSS
jgi:hypothetical protein